MAFSVVPEKLLKHFRKDTNPANQFPEQAGTNAGNPTAFQYEPMPQIDECGDEIEAGVTQLLTNKLIRGTEAQLNLGPNNFITRANLPASPASLAEIFRQDNVYSLTNSHPCLPLKVRISFSHRTAVRFNAVNANEAASSDVSVWQVLERNGVIAAYYSSYNVLNSARQQEGDRDQSNIVYELAPGATDTFNRTTLYTLVSGTAPEIIFSNAPTMEVTTSYV